MELDSKETALHLTVDILGEELHVRSGHTLVVEIADEQFENLARRLKELALRNGIPFAESHALKDLRGWLAQLYTRRVCAVVSGACSVDGREAESVCRDAGIDPGARFDRMPWTDRMVLGLWCATSPGGIVLADNIGLDPDGERRWVQAAQTIARTKDAAILITNRPLLDLRVAAPSE